MSGNQSYDFNLSVGITELLDMDSAAKVEDQIKKQKQKIEEPVEIKVELEVGPAKKQIKDLQKEMKAAALELKKLKGKQINATNAQLYSTHHDTIKRNQREIDGIVAQLKKQGVAVSTVTKEYRELQEVLVDIGLAEEKVNKKRKPANADKPATKRVKKQKPIAEDQTKKVVEAVERQESKAPEIKAETKANDERARSMERTNELHQEELDLIAKKRKAEAEAVKESAEYLAAQETLMQRWQNLKSGTERGNFGKKQIYSGREGRLTLAASLATNLADFNLSNDELDKLIESTYDQFSKLRDLIVDRQTWVNAIRNELNTMSFDREIGAIYSNDTIRSHFAKNQDFLNIYEQVRSGALSAADAIKQATDIASQSGFVTMAEEESRAAKQATQAIEDKIEKTEEFADATEKATKAQEDFQKAEAKAIKSMNNGRPLKTFDLANMTAKTKSKELREIKDFAQSRWNDVHGDGKNISDGWANFIKKDGTSFEIYDDIVRIYDESGKEVVKHLSEMSASAFKKLMTHIVYAVYDVGNSVKSDGSIERERVIDTQSGDLSSYIAKDNELYNESRKYVAAYREEVQKLHGALHVNEGRLPRLSLEEAIKYETLAIDTENVRKYYEEQQRIEREAFAKQQEFNELKDPYFEHANRPKNEQTNMFESDADREIKFLEARVKYHKRRKQLIEECDNLVKEYQKLPIQNYNPDYLAIHASTEFEQEYIEDFERKIEREKDKLVSALETHEQVVEKLKEFIALRKKQAELFNAGEDTSEYYRPIRDAKVALLGGITDSAERMHLDSELDINAHQPGFKFDDIANRITSGLGIKLPAAIQQNEESVEKLTSSYEGLAEAVQKFADINTKVWDKYNSGSDIKELASLIEERNAAIENIISFFPQELSEPTLTQLGISGQLQSREFAEVSAAEHLQRLERQLTEARELQAQAAIAEAEATDTDTAATEKNIKSKSKLQSLSNGDKNVLVQLFKDKDFANRNGREFDPLEELSMRVSAGAFKRLRPRVKEIMNNAVSQLGLEYFGEAVEHYLNEEVLANSEALLFTLFEDYFKRGISQLSLDKWIEEIGGYSEHRTDAVKMLNGLSVNYPDFINFADTFGLGSINLRVPQIESATQAQEKLATATGEVAPAANSATQSIKKLLLHAGYLGDIENTMPSFPLGNTKPSVNSGDFAALTGLYTISDTKKLIKSSEGFLGNEWENSPVSIIDPSFYKMLDATNVDKADQLNDFIRNLHATIYGYAIDSFTGEMADPSTFKTVEQLYTQLGSLVDGINMDFESFAKFINDASAIVKGHDFKDLELPAIDEGVAKSGISSALQDVADEIFSSDNFATQLLRTLGFEGVDVSGTKYDSTYKGGSVIFGKIKPESIVEQDIPWSEFMSRYGRKQKKVDVQRDAKRLQLEQEKAKTYSRVTATNLQQENNLLEEKIANLKTINALIAQEELGEEEIVELVNAYRSAMEAATDPAIYKEANDLMGQIAEKFAEAAGLEANVSHDLLKDVTLSGAQVVEYFEQLAEGVPLDEIRKLNSSADHVGDSYDEAAANAEELRQKIGKARQEAEKLVKVSGALGFHGTPTGGYKEVDMGRAKNSAAYWLTDNLDLATKYANGARKDIDLESDDKNQKGIYTYKVNGENVWVVDAKGNGSGSLIGAKADGSDTATINGKPIIPSDSELVYKLVSKMGYEYKKQGDDYLRADPNKKLVYGDPNFPGVVLNINGQKITAYGTAEQVIEQLLQKGVEETVINTLMYLSKTGSTQGSLPFNKKLNTLAQTNNNAIAMQAFANGADAVQFDNIANEGVSSTMWAVKDPTKQLEFVPKYIAGLQEVGSAAESAAESQEKLSKTSSEASNGIQVIENRVKKLVETANQIPQEPDTTRFVHFTRGDLNQPILDNGLRLENNGLLETALYMEQYVDAAEDFAKASEVVKGVAGHHGLDDNAVIMDIPNDSIVAYTDSVGRLDTVSNNFIRATVDTKNGLYALNNAYSASHDVIDDYADAITAVRDAEEQSGVIRRPGVKHSDQLEATSNRIIGGRIATDELVKFDAIKDDQFQDYSEWAIGDEWQGKVRDAFDSIRGRVESGIISCEQAYLEIGDELFGFWNQMQSDTEEAAKTVRKLSGKQRNEMFKDASFKKLFEQYHVSTRDQDVIYDELHNLADMIASESDAGSIEDQKSQIISLIAKAAKLERETGLEDVFDALKSSKIYYDQSEIKEIGKNTWRDEKSHLSSMNLLTTSREKGSRADTYFGDLSEYVQGMVAETFEKEHKTGFTGTKSSIIQGIAALIKHAPDRLVGVTGEEQDYVRGEAAGIIDKVIGNVRNLLIVEQGVSAELEEQNDIREEGAKITGSTPKPSGDGGPKFSGDNDDEKRPNFIDTDIDTALKQLRTALHNKTDLIDLREVDTPDKLETQISNMAQEILKDSTKLSLGSVVAQGDVARVTLYNKELGVTVSQVYQLKKAAEDAEDAIDGVGKATLQHMPDADVYKHDVKAAQAYSDAQQRQADKNDKWLIQQLAKLDKQELSYKYSSKKVDGGKSLINEDAKYAGKTIEGLSQSIRERANNAMGGVLTEAVKNEITDSLRVLDHEIKVAQSEKYKKGVLSAQEATEAKATNEYKLDAFEAKAKNNNIFTQLAEDIRLMRSELKGVTEQDSSGLDRFVDKFRTAEAKFKAEMTKQQGEKQEERDLQSVLNLQERLYEIKKKQAELEVKGELDTAEGQKVSRRAAELQEEYEASLALLKNTEDRNAAMQRQAQLEKEVGAVRAEQEAKQEAADKKNAEQERAQQIEKYYQSVLETVNRINSIDSKINDLKFKDGGSGIYSGLIEQLESEKTALLGRIDQIGDAINQEFNGVFKSVGDLDKVSFSFDSLLKNTGAYGILLDFFNDTEVRATLATEKIDKFVQAIDKSQNIEFDFKSKINDQFDSVDKLVSKLKEINEALGDKSNLGSNARYQEIMQMFGVFEQLKAYGDENGWTAQGLAFFEQAAAQVSKYSNELIQATEQERKYFANKQKVSGSETYDDYTRPPSNELSTYVDKKSAANKLPGGDIAATQKQKLEEYIAAYSKGRGIITDFIKTANGVNKIEFSIIDETVGELRTFSVEMGQFSDNIYMTETTMKNLTGGTDAAKKAINELVEAIARLNQMKAGGADVDVDGQIAKLEEKLQALTSKLSSTGDSKDIGSQTAYKNLAADAREALKETAKLEQEWAKVQALLDDPNSGVENLGKINQAGDVYAQMMAKIRAAAGDATVSNVKFDKATNTLTYTLTNANKEVTEMVAKMHQLNSVVTTQQGKVGHLKNWWQDLGVGVKGIGNQIGRYAVNMLQVMDIVRYLRRGFEAVREIDLALTELKKVTDETEASYRKFLTTASQTAGQIGSTVSDFTTASANFARLGYTMEESADMAKTAIVYKNVADGLDTVEESTESIISTMKAFGIEADDTMSIVDRFNAVGNSFAITSAGIGDALQRSASALYEAGNTIDESVALVTTANSVIQNPEQVGECLPTIKVAI